MAGRLLTLSTRAIRSFKVPFGAAGEHSEVRALIGNREIVGYGFNGQPSYVDRADYPAPAIRWKETTPDVAQLREKEKGDWRKLSKEEKKALYRASYRQTFAEFKAPTGEWKSILGFTCLLISAGLFTFYTISTFVYEPRPASFSEESKRAQLRRMIDLQMNPVTGLASKWDYEKDDWKK